MKDFIITSLDEENKKAKSTPGVEFPVREVTQPLQGQADQTIKEYNVEVFPK